MMDRETALAALDLLEAYGMNARRRAASESEQWIECFSSRTGRVNKTLRTPADVAQFMRLPDRDFARHAAAMRAERASFLELTDCAECGHLHYAPEAKIWAACPVCDCKGQS